VRLVHEAFGGLDILVNNAGIASSQKFTELDIATWCRTIEVDLSGPFYLLRAALPLMLQQQSGTVIAIASTASLIGKPYVAAYTAAKHGLLGLIRSLSAEYSGSGITFNCVCPGFADTAMTTKSIEDIVVRTRRSKEEARRALLSPQGRLITAEEIADFCVMIASDAGRSVNGQALVIDGGAVQSR
jgi:NAD(P)-dependent dehydrogenase (short-subunit alcohol dehydrogenase family)